MGPNYVFLFILPVTFSYDIFSKDHLKIVGGEATDIIRYPSMASIRYGEKHTHICGGSILTHLWILSAGHCVCPDPLKRCLRPEEVRVVVGSSYCDQELNDTSVEYWKVKNTYHPGYEIGKDDNDISLLKLQKDLTFTDKIVPANILPSGFFKGVEPWNIYTKCRAVGWGSLKEGFENNSIVLHHIDLPLIPLKKCQTLWDSTLYDTDLCTLDNTGKDACTGDSGSPLFCGGYVIAVCSRSYGCAHRDEPNIWTRVDKYQDWISVTVKGHSADIFGEHPKNRRSWTESSKAMKLLTVVLACILVSK